MKNGTVQKKHRWDYYVREYDVGDGDGRMPIIWEPAARGCRHVVTEEDLRRFLEIIPEWERYSTGLRGLVLGDGDDDCYGWHDVGVVCIHAWSSEIEETWESTFFDEHRPILDRLMVPYELDEKAAEVHCAFTKKTAAGFLLMHVFLHELGHHYDRMQTRTQLHGRGDERIAESFGNDLAERMWSDFYRAFAW